MKKQKIKLASKIGIAFLTAYILAVIIATPFMAKYAREWRKSDAIGGEYLPIITIPYAIYGIYKLGKTEEETK
jgi:hypothetical protein